MDKWNKCLGQTIYFTQPLNKTINVIMQGSLALNVLVTH